MAHDRDVGGIRCLEVLALLPDFLDGGLTDNQLGRVHAHLAGCDWCERFGGEYASTVTSLRESMPQTASAGRVAQILEFLD